MKMTVHLKEQSFCSHNPIFDTIHNIFKIKSAEPHGGGGCRGCLLGIELLIISHIVR